MISQNTLASLNHLNTKTSIPLVFEVPLKIFQNSLPLSVCYTKEQGIYLDHQLITCFHSKKIIGP